MRQLTAEVPPRTDQGISLGEHHTNDDPALCRQMIGDFFPEGGFSREAKPGSIALVTVRVVEEDMSAD